MKKRVLVVDDDPMVLKATSRQLEHTGFDVVRAEGVLNAKLLLESQKFDAIVTDRDMPDGGGAVVCEVAVTKEIPCVVYTGNGEGVAHPWVVMKPATEEILSAAVWGVLKDMGRI